MTSGLITFRGRTQSLWQWAKEVRIKHQTLASRLRRGVSVEDAFAAKPMAGRQRRAVPAPKPAASPYAEVSRTLAAELGVSRQRVDQIARSAATKVMLRAVALMAMEWSAAARVSLSDNEIADIVALVATDPDVRRLVRGNQIDVAQLCEARLRQRKAESEHQAA